MHDNQLSGNIPNFSNLSNLTNLSLQNNQLSGSIPDFNNLPNLSYLSLQNNQLSGSIPAFNNLPALYTLQICPNNLTGNIPGFYSCDFLNVNSIDFSCVIAAQTTGIVYVDANKNCIKDEDEAIIPNTVIATTDSTSYSFSDESGFYTLKTDTGLRNFNCIMPNYLWEQNCLDHPNAYTIHPISYQDSLGGFDFGLQYSIECPLMIVEVGTPFLRRCFTNTYTVHYCNTGTATAEDAEIHLSLGEAIIPLESSMPYNEDTENYLVFNIGTVGIGQCGSFTLTDSLSCDAILGSTACMEAFAFPNDLCFEDASLWDGSDLEINAACLGDSVIFEIRNTGEDMLVESEYRMYEDDLLTLVEPLFLTAGEVLTLSHPASGQTFRVTAQQTPNHPISTFVTAVVELCGTENMASVGFVNTQSNVHYSRFYNINCQEIIGSYDPNDKAVTPKGVGDEHRITDSQELEYKIRFQNIGSDTAFRVVVIDTIDTKFLDINSLKLGVSSHDYTAEVKDGKVLIFTFENIFLVDSATNEMASNGFLMFKISQNIGNQRDDLIQNEAAIYFDYNQPVITNKTFNTIGLPHLTTDIPIITQVQGTIPASIFYENEHLYIKLSVVSNNEQYSFRLYDALGRFVTQIDKLSIPNHELLVGNLTKGVYVFEIQATNGKKTTGKFMVQ